MGNKVPVPIDYKGAYMFAFINIIIPLVISIVVILAIVRNNRILDVVAVILLVLVLLERESSMSNYPRILIERSPLKGEMLDSYRNGINLIADFNDATSIFVIVIAILLVVLSARCFRKPFRKHHGQLNVHSDNNGT
jgi:hypothetical protein